LLTAATRVGKKYCSQTSEKTPKRLSLSFTGSLSSAKHNSVPALCKVSSNSPSASAAVTSTLVTGSAATTNQRTGLGDLATTSKARSLNNSALAKNKGASQRKRTRPGIWRASG